MPRIPTPELERLKAEVSVQRLVEAAGVELKKSGKDWLGRCPWHDDRDASLVVSPGKNLWHCFGCAIGGGPIDWVMKHRGLSFRHAVELLKVDPALVAGAADGAAPVKRSTVRALPAPVALDADDQALLGQVVGYYHQRLKETEEARAYLVSRGLDHPGLIDAFELGVADRTLGLRLPEKNRQAGAELRGRLQRLGVLRESGHEHYNGALVVPVRDAAGRVVELYGRKLRHDPRTGQSKHLVLRRPEGEASEDRHRGVFNLAGVVAAGQRPKGAREVILCEALIDAMSFWCAGFTQVTASYGTSGFGADHLAAFKANGIERILIAYDRDEAGDRAAEKLGAQLVAEGFEVLRVLFPMGMDANEYACKFTPAAQSLGLVLRQAQWLGGVPTVPPAAEEKSAEPAAPAELAEPAPAAISAEAPPSLAAGVEELPQDLPDELQLETGALSWRVRGWKKNLIPEAMKVNLTARTKAEAGAYFMDTLDLYAARSRAAFLKAAAMELGLAEDAVKRELGAVLLRLEALQDAHISQLKDGRGAAKAPVLSVDDEAKALELLRAPDLVGRIVADLHALGVVGEDLNLLAAYLAATSRKLDAPLAVLIQSSSAAGKSSLMDAVLQLMPEEERIRYSAMTGQSLFYLGETNLQHKILAIAEEEGVRQAAYALKILQSDGELTIASTAKDEATGNLATRQYTVKGPVMLMLTTTAIDVDEELLNRCLVLAVNESAEQTAAIHEGQRQRRTLGGLLDTATREAIRALHHNAQRLLAPVGVVNPYAPVLSFATHKTRTRRDHMKYLTLIESIALIHQHQREVKTVEHQGQTLSYIEVTRSDIELANAIAHEVLGRTLDELPPQTRRLLGLIHVLVREKAQTQRVKPADVRFTRRDVREFTQWSDSQLQVHCARLVEMEYLLIHGGSRGHSLRYELLWDGGEPEADAQRRRHLCGLTDPAELDELAAQMQLRRTQLGAVEAQLVANWPPIGPHLGAIFAPQEAAQTKARIEEAGYSGRNGSKTHILSEAPNVPRAVVTAVKAGKGH